MKILHIIPSVNPKGGGPMEGVRQRGFRLKELGHSVEVVTLDDPSSDFLASYGLPVHALGPSTGSYQYNPRLVPWLCEHAHKFDSVIINGIWQYHSFGAWRALRKIGKPYYVFTHGMMDPWFKNTYPLKHLKKWIYWPWADYRVLRDAESVLFTSEDEKVLARQSFWLYKAKETVVAYGTKTPPEQATSLREAFLAQWPELRGKRVLLFLSRIQEKKGCDLLIQAFAKVAKENSDLHLLMAGPDQTGLVTKLKAMAESLGIASRISWTGMLQGDAKWGAFYSSEAFVLPSHQENFGIAVAEALACGLPVLISDKINIWREIKADEAGVIFPDTLAGTTQGLEEWLSYPLSKREALGGNSRKSFNKRFTIDAMAQDLLRVLRANDPA
jgi:glycosyltransferase involved in cell wall biosynthesis